MKEDIKIFLDNPIIYYLGSKAFRMRTPQVERMEVLMVTYRSLVLNDRFHALEEWLGDDFKGLVCSNLSC